MATFITRGPGSGDGVRLAVKDLIDVAGVPTGLAMQLGRAFTADPLSAFPSACSRPMDH
jgi:Asp-tRNA(Asn)/Glu-tRNA(Gln) amidotransferase A subunit family amidase